MARVLARGERIEIRGFGSFAVKQRRARQGRNPKTGDVVAVEAKRIPFFRAGKELRVEVNGARRTQARDAVAAPERRAERAARLWAPWRAAYLRASAAKPGRRLYLLFRHARRRASAAAGWCSTPIRSRW